MENIPVFCDWLKLRFRASSLSEAFERYVSCHSQQGEHWRKLTWVTVKSFNAEGAEMIEDKSSASSIVKCKYNPETGFVDVDGNLGRFGHADNVWGRGVYSSAWNFLNPFIATERFQIKSDVELRRVDLTANVTFRDSQDAYAFLAWAKGQKVGYAHPTPYATGVAWVTENWSAKIYDKLADLKRHKMTPLADTLEGEVGYLLRFEMTLRTDELVKRKVDKLTDWQNEVDIMNVIFSDKFKPILRGGAMVDEVTSDMPARLANAVEAWRNGRNFNSMVADHRMSRATYYRLRKELLPFGIDISQPVNVQTLNIRPREVPFQFVDAPSWYRKRAA